jgi:hypothetical protein
MPTTHGRTARKSIVTLMTTLLLLLASHQQSRAADAGTDGDFKPLFNGKDLTGWDGDPRFWRAQDGVIIGETTKETPAPHNTFLIYKGDGFPAAASDKPLPGKKFADFELHAKFKLRNHNSGIQYRSKELPDHVMSGYQADIAEGKPSPYTGMLYEEKARGIVAKRGQKVTIDEQGKKTVEQFGDDKEMGNAIDMSQWHDYTIIAKGNHLTQMIDGKTTMELIDNEPGKSASTGYIGLQIHAGQPMKVEFKDIGIKELKD